MRYIFYCIIDKESLIIETIYSILSINYFVSKRESIRFIIATNMRQRIESILQATQAFLVDQIDFFEITEQQVCQWTNQRNYMYGAKLKAVEAYMSVHAGDYIFLDCDTCAVKDCLPLFEVIHQGKTLTYSAIRKMMSFSQFPEAIVQDDHILLPGDGIQLRFHKQDNYYNTGIIGMNSALVHKLKQTISIMDIILKNNPYNGADDLAFSYIYRNNTEVVPAYPYFMHYFAYDEIRLFVAYALQWFYPDDRENLQEYLFSMGLSMEIMHQLDLNMHNVHCFSFIFLSYREHRQINPASMVVQAIVRGFIHNTESDKLNFLHCAKRFQDAFSHHDNG